MAKEKYKELEEKYSEFIGHKYGVATNSGTSALHLALLAIGVKAGDEVIVPDFTMAACGFAVSYTGATPVFVDCADDLNIDVKKIERKITPNTKAIMAVHIYGRLCNMEKINEIAKKYNLFVIEDACEAQGAKVGNADISCFSFYKNKIISAEEGGIATTNNQAFADKMNYYKNMSFGKEHDYFHNEIGYNYRMPESQAELALKSLANFEKNFEKRKKIEEWYNKYVPEPMKIFGDRDAVWVYDVAFSKNHKVVGKVNGLRHFFKPLSSMPMWGGKCQNGNAEFYSKVGMYFPVDIKMTENSVKRIVNSVLCER